MRLVLPLTLALVVASVTSVAQVAEQPAPLAQSMSDFERNIALGSALQVREGTTAELAELRSLADRGLKQAREAVAKQPDSAEAHYWLGSWLLYGYGVVEVEQISFDAQGTASTETVTRVVQGLSDDPEEGLGALKKSVELAPKNGDYLLDYAAALADYDRADGATGILKGVWVGQPTLSQEQRMRAAILLAGLAAAQGDLAGAREWVYSALSLDPASAVAIEMLRELDLEQAGESVAPPAAGGEEWPEDIVAEPELPEAGTGYEEGYESAPEEGYDEGAGLGYEEQQSEEGYEGENSQAAPEQPAGEEEPGASEEWPEGDTEGGPGG